MKKKGFSLVEILVSIAIIGILSGIGIQAFVASRQRARLEEDVAKVVQALRKAQNAALAPSRSETGIATVSTLCAIGVKIDQTNRTIQLIYQTGTTSCSGENNYGTATTLNYASIDPLRDSVIVFETPFAKTSGGVVELSIDNGGNRISKTIEVTNSGLIKVE